VVQLYLKNVYFHNTDYKSAIIYIKPNNKNNIIVTAFRCSPLCSSQAYVGQYLAPRNAPYSHSVNLCWWLREERNIVKYTREVKPGEMQRP
jgi:hypothetical protein